MRNKEYVWVASHAQQSELKAAARQGLEFLESYKFSIPPRRYLPLAVKQVPNTFYNETPSRSRNTGGFKLPRNGQILPGYTGHTLIP